MSSQRLIYAALLAAALLLATPLALARLWYPMLAALIIPALWAVARRRGWRSADQAALAGLTFLALLALAQAATPPALPLAGLTAALSAWTAVAVADLWRAVDEVPEAKALERRIIRRLLAVAGVGLSLGLVANAVRLNFGFGVAVVLALVSVLGLTRAITFLRDAAGEK